MSLIATAMLVYPGGTWWDKNAQGHRFWENFLCDLLHRQSLSGKTNLMGSRLAEIALFLLAISVLAAFSLCPELVPSRRAFAKKLGWIGAITALLLFLPPLFPSDAHPTLHSVTIVFGTAPAMLAFAVLVGLLLVEPRTPLLLRGTSVTLLVLLTLSIALYTWDVFWGGPLLKLLPAVERVATLLAVAFLFQVSRYVRSRLIQAYRHVIERSRRA